MQPSCEPLHSWDRGRSNTLAMSQRFVHKEFRRPFFLHSAASAITSPSPQSVFPRSIPNKGAQVLVTSAISAPGEGHSRVGRKNLPRIRSSEITSTLCTPFVCLQTNVCSWPLSLISAKDSYIPL